LRFVGVVLVVFVLGFGFEVLNGLDVGGGLGGGSINHNNPDPTLQEYLLHHLVRSSMMIWLSLWKTTPY
jgi:hypothetical protein